MSRADQHAARAARLRRRRTCCDQRAVHDAKQQARMATSWRARGKRKEIEKEKGTRNFRCALLAAGRSPLHNAEGGCTTRDEHDIEATAGAFTRPPDLR
ncbi:hypothetical protein MTO96_006225 [Rhipicephalus appendiculatus]